MHLLELKCVVGPTVVKVMTKTCHNQRQALKVGQVALQSARLESRHEQNEGFWNATI